MVGFQPKRSRALVISGQEMPEDRLAVEARKLQATRLGMAILARVIGELPYY